MPCMCGDSECSSCGSAQGTRTPRRPDTLAELRALARRVRLDRTRAHELTARVATAAQAAHAAGMPVATIATALGVTRQHAHRLVHGRHDR